MMPDNSPFYKYVQRYFLGEKSTCRNLYTSSNFACVIDALPSHHASSLVKKNKRPRGLGASYSLSFPRIIPGESWRFTEICSSRGVCRASDTMDLIGEVHLLDLISLMNVKLQH
jgi:hypothetical protein